MVHAQVPACWAHWQAIGGPFGELDRSLQLQDSAARAPAVTRYGAAVDAACGTDHSAPSFDRKLEWSLLPVGTVAQSNSAYAVAQQDGLRWAGRGLSFGFTGGASLRWGPLSAAVSPVATYQQNEAYAVLTVTTPGFYENSEFFHRGAIDRPQRFGTSPFWKVHPGQSFVRVDGYGAALGVSTENLRFGPARRNPLIMSGAAPGFPHVFLGTGKPLDLGIADVQFEAIWGRLAESDFFDNKSSNDRRLFSAAVGTIEPRGSGLTLGFSRAYLRIIPPSGLSLGEQILGPYTGIRDNPQEEENGDNQVVSVFFSWVLPRSQFEVYGEYAREDHWEDASDLLMQLDHSRAYTLGVEKLFPLGTRMLRVGAETTNLANSPTWESGRAGATFYVHAQVVQGYTHRGQLLGAPIGPGADAQYVGVDYLTPRFVVGGYYQRARYENDIYYRHFARERSNRGHDAEWTVGLRGSHVLRNVHLVADLALSTRHNRGFVAFVNTPITTFSTDRNLSISLGAAWIPALGGSVR